MVFMKHALLNRVEVCELWPSLIVGGRVAAPRVGEAGGSGSAGSGMYVGILNS
jgi:hypothetical protein